jgi:hypothetical protein
MNKGYRSRRLINNALQTDVSKASRSLQSKGRATFCHAAERKRYALEVA